MNKKLRIGEISYSNCTPIYSTLKKRFDCSGYEFVPGDPATLNAMLASGEIDVSASSSIEYARHCGEYLIIPDISISADGEVRSILLFSGKPIERLDGEMVAVSSASATSAVMLKALLKGRYGIDANYVARKPELVTMLEGCAAALLIGDEALKERKALPEGSGMHVYDLGLLWREFTGLSFVFALWMVREDTAIRSPALVNRLAGDLSAAKELAARDFDDIAREAPEASWMGAGELADYWRLISYDLGEGHIMGLKMFFRMAHDLGEVRGCPELRFLK